MLCKYPPLGTLTHHPWCWTTSHQLDKDVLRTEMNPKGGSTKQVLKNNLVPCVTYVELRLSTYALFSSRHSCIGDFYWREQAVSTLGGDRSDPHWATGPRSGQPTPPPDTHHGAVILLTQPPTQAGAPQMLGKQGLKLLNLARPHSDHVHELYFTAGGPS